MKGGDRSNAPVATAEKAKGSFYKFLKPGALAKLRDSKITARSKKRGLQTQASLYDLLLLSAATASSPPPESAAPGQTDWMPCFTARIGNRTRCLQRKKLSAVSPVFVEPEH